MEENKKTLKVGALAMTFLAISIIFSILAYGYGSATMAREWSNWCNTNYEYVAAEHGYSLLRNEVDTERDSVAANIINKVNLSYKNISVDCNNATNTTSCEAI